MFSTGTVEGVLSPQFTADSYVYKYEASMYRSNLLGG